MPRREREPPAPTALDEVMSANSLASSPWVKARIRELGLEGKKVNTWLPPQFNVRYVQARWRSTSNWEAFSAFTRIVE